ncbi:hypothetical protein E3N88_20617 [Mikania micrantha]|uniref:Uncharacterized protein n=1 Tax=Mikania micrantha TaxID=192012 RepID=A0A5N6NHX8_9ASTR|nr:hypothetical protein E3N88_20617 [Mikania micrantha]
MEIWGLKLDLVRLKVESIQPAMKSDQENQIFVSAGKGKRELDFLLLRASTHASTASPIPDLDIQMEADRRSRLGLEEEIRKERHERHEMKL